MPEQLTVAEFREMFPEFSEENFPDDIVTARLDLANHFFSESRYGDMRPHAMGLYAAHYLVLAKRDGATDGSSFTGTGSGGTGIIASKSVDGASVSYDVSSGAEEGAGSWNLTRYGRELWQLIRLYGAGMMFVI